MEHRFKSTIRKKWRTHLPRYRRLTVKVRTTCLFKLLLPICNTSMFPSILPVHLNTPLGLEVPYLNLEVVLWSLPGIGDLTWFVRSQRVLLSTILWKRSYTSPPLATSSTVINSSMWSSEQIPLRTVYTTLTVYYLYSACVALFFRDLLSDSLVFTGSTSSDTLKTDFEGCPAKPTHCPNLNDALVGRSNPLQSLPFPSLVPALITSTVMR